jgi:hypothetical protein
MAKQYQPQVPFNVPALHLKRSTQKINGVNQETFTEGVQFFCSAKSYGGTEKTVNGVYVIEDTWQIDTWYNPAFGKGDRVRFLDDNTEYEILASPENINRRGQYMRFKVVRISG